MVLSAFHSAGMVSMLFSTFALGSSVTDTFNLTTEKWLKSRHRAVSIDAEITSFALRDAPREDIPVIYNICSKEGRSVLFIHLRRAGGTSLINFLDHGVGEEQCHRKDMIRRVETYLHIFHRKDGAWSLEDEFGSIETSRRPLSVFNIRDPMKRMWSMYNFEKRWDRSVGFGRESLPTNSSPIYFSSPQGFFQSYPDNFYVRVLCCKGMQMEKKVGGPHLARAKAVLEHEFGIVPILEWFSDPRFQHYLYSTLDARKTRPFECYLRSFDMFPGQKDLLGVVKFENPAFETIWRNRNNLDFELFRFAKRLTWRRMIPFWNRTNGELVPFGREFPVVNWTDKSNFVGKLRCR